METNILGIRISIFLDCIFLARFRILPAGETQNQNSKIIVSGKLYHFCFMVVVQRWQGCTLGIRLGPFRQGYECLDAYERKSRTAQIPVNEPFGFSRFLGRGSFLSPGQATLRDYPQCSALAIPTLRFLILCLVCSFRFRFLDCNSGQALVLQSWTPQRKCPRRKMHVLDPPSHSRTKPP